MTIKSAKDYLSERQAASGSDEKRIFRMIYRSHESNARKLALFLEQSKGKVDVTSMVDRQGFTPLNYAIFKEKSSAARALIDHVRSLELATSSEVQTSSLGQQSPRSELPTAALTLAEWVNSKNTKQSGMSAIHYAAFTGDLSLMRELVARGADVRIKNQTGMSVLQFAAQGNQAAVITYLLDCHGFDINEVDSKNSSAVHWAIFNAQELALKFLLARGPRINEADIKGITPLHLAVLSGEQDKTTLLIRMLLMRGANPHA